VSRARETHTRLQGLWKGDHRADGRASWKGEGTREGIDLRLPGSRTAESASGSDPGSYQRLRLFRSGQQAHSDDAGDRRSGREPALADHPAMASRMGLGDRAGGEADA